MRYACLLYFVLAAPAAAAEEMAPRAGDAVLDAPAMRAVVIGQTHEFFDGGRSFFSISGSYSYTYPDGGVAYGDWQLPAGGADGVICTEFRHGFARCDRYVRSGGRLVLITEDNLRFPVRVNSAAD